MHIAVAFTFAVLTSVASVEASTETGWTPTVRCDNLTRVRVSAKALIRASILTITHSTTPFFNCTKATSVKPISPHVDYTLVFTSGDRAFYMDISLENGDKTVKAILCLTGYNATYYVYASKLNDPAGGYICPYGCTSDGVSFSYFACAIVGNKVNPEITHKIIPFIKSSVSGGEDMFDATANCAPPAHCTHLP